MKMIRPTAEQVARLADAVTEMQAALKAVNVDSYLERAHAIRALEGHERSRAWGEGSLQVSAGFVAEDLRDVFVGQDLLTVNYCCQHERFSRQVKMTDLNRRELREMVKFLNTVPNE